MNDRTKKTATTIAAFLMVALAATLHAQPRYETLHTFSGDRGRPTAALTEGPDGKLYGTTRFGGFHGKGSVFVTDGGGIITTLHEFNGTDGEAPAGRLLFGPDGMLYGTTSSSAGGFGTIFRLTPDGTGFEVLVEFTGPNGLLAQSGLVLGSDGALYGTTSAGGDTGVGTIFRLTTAGGFSTLVSFGGANGATPSGDLIATSDGLYGTTAEGGAGFGTVFHAALDGTVTTLVAFDGSGGTNPAGGVVLAGDGSLYGTTRSGGANALGTVFRISAGVLETLHSFSGPDGASPTGALRELADGQLYGTTSEGGTANSGAIFRIAPDGTVETIASFAITDGNFPASGVIQTIGGAIYGTTEAGGPGLYGTIFELTPGALIRTAASFSGAAIADPIGGLTQATDGNFYGIALGGGAEGLGAVFRMTPDGIVTTLASFRSDEGLFPTGALMQASNGDLYGTTEGGLTGDGGVFRVTLDGTLTTIGLFDFLVNGAAPSGRLIEGSDGDLYGTTLFGANGAPGGVFKVSRSDGSISVVATFANDESHGVLPAAGLVEAADGSFYGTARMGGANALGTIFRVSGGQLSTVVSFNGNNGWDPASPLLVGSDGSLYGTTAEGGETGNGTLFRLTLDPTPVLTTLVSFDGLNGWWPFQQGVIETSNGVFAGTTSFGGAGGLGTAYQWSESGIVVLHEFDGVSGELPNATLMKASDGGLYGTAFGPQGGVIYRLVSDQPEASLLLAPASAIYGGTTTLVATLTASGAPISGAEISFSLNGAALGSALTDASGLASLAGVSVAGIGAGTYPGVVAASFAGNDVVAAAAATGDLVIAPATPVVAVQGATFTYDGQAHPAAATATGVAGEALGPLTITYNGSAASPIDPGTYEVVASFAGDDNYAPASAAAVITILPAPAGLSGLVAAYGFNEGGGTIAGDASGRGHVGRIKQAQWTSAGRFGGALDFDGVNDWVTVRDAPALSIRNAITIEAWVNPQSLSGWNTIALKETDDGLAYALYANNSLPQPAGYVRVSGADRAVAGPAPLALNVWSHVAMTYNGSTMRLFVNGVEVRRRSLTGRISSSDKPLRIGGNSVWGEYFDGLIDEVRLYGRALSVSEIQRDMNMPVAFESAAPSVAIDSPVDGVVLSGLPAVQVTATDNLGISNVQLQADGIDVGSAMVKAPYSTRLDLANGTYVLTAVARDLAGNMAVSAPVIVTIENAPVAAYDFEEDNGSAVVDGSGRNNHGTMSAGVSRTLDATRGRVLSFNGADGLVTVADADSLDLTTGMTLEAWVRPTALGGWRTVILKEGDGLSYSLYADDDVPGPSAYVRINDVDRAVLGRERIPLSDWTHLAMTYDGEMLRLFVDGQELASRPQTGAAEVSNGALRIGGNTVWGEWFRGQIDSVRVYPVAIGEAQIKADMQR